MSRHVEVLAMWYQNPDIRIRLVSLLWYQEFLFSEIWLVSGVSDVMLRDRVAVRGSHFGIGVVVVLWYYQWLCE